jgi:hypothetical protein
MRDLRPLPAEVLLRKSVYVIKTARKVTMLIRKSIKLINLEETSLRKHERNQSRKSLLLNVLNKDLDQ